MARKPMDPKFKQAVLKNCHYALAELAPSAKQAHRALGGDDGPLAWRVINELWAERGRLPSAETLYELAIGGGVNPAYVILGAGEGRPPLRDPGTGPAGGDVAEAFLDKLRADLAAETHLAPEVLAEILPTPVDFYAKQLADWKATIRLAQRMAPGHPPGDLADLFARSKEEGEYTTVDGAVSYTFSEPARVEPPGRRLEESLDEYLEMGRQEGQARGLDPAAPPRPRP